MKLRLAVALSALTCAFGASGLTMLTTVSSAQTTPGLSTKCASTKCLVQKTTGTAGGKKVNLTTKVNKFVHHGAKLLANTTTSGTVNGSAIAPVTKNVPVSTGNAKAARVASCSILHLILGPLHLNLLGLVIDLNQLNLNITGQTGPGNLLGNLLCGLTNSLNPSQISAVTNALNNLLGAA
jgi:hypothetical protein